MARRKIGAITEFVSAIGDPISIGDRLRHSVTGVCGIVDMYGKVKGDDGTGYKLANNIWEHVDAAPADDYKEEREDPLPENHPEPEVDYGSIPDAPIIEPAPAFDIAGVGDQELADELRRRGYEVTARKVIEICL